MEVSFNKRVGQVIKNLTGSSKKKKKKKKRKNVVSTEHPNEILCFKFPTTGRPKRHEGVLSLVNRVNLNEGFEIEVRPSDLEYDIRRPVVRWDSRHYEEIFQSGFRARPRGDTHESAYYNLLHYVNSGGAPLAPNRSVTHGFVSTTLNEGWQPIPNLRTLQRGQLLQFFRYEIYAPGGIWVAVTLRNRYRYPDQAEVCFVGGIAPQFIRSWIVYVAIRDPDSNHVSFARDSPLIINRNFNPQAYPYALVHIYIPTHTYVDENCVEIDLPEETYPPSCRHKRDISGSHDHSNTNDDALEWYTRKVIDNRSYVNAAFRASTENEAYLFMQNKYVLVNYAPGTTYDKRVNGPLLICDGFPSLIGTPFGEYGIECAFDTDDYNEAFIFSANLCALIDYAPGTTNDKILSGPMPIASMFPFFKGTVFEHGIDAAFKATAKYEAYLFRREQYALINYHSKTLIAIRKITDGFHSLRGTVFASDVDAAFASHRADEAYLFKGDSYALINFAPGTTDDYIVGGTIKKILPNWPSLRGVLPLLNKGLDFHVHHGHGQDHTYHQHDEL